MAPPSLYWADALSLPLGNFTSSGLMPFSLSTETPSR